MSLVAGTFAWWKIPCKSRCFYDQRVVCGLERDTRASPLTGIPLIPCAGGRATVIALLVERVSRPVSAVGPAIKPVGLISPGCENRGFGPNSPSFSSGLEFVGGKGRAPHQQGVPLDHSPGDPPTPMPPMGSTGPLGSSHDGIPKIR